MTPLRELGHRVVWQRRFGGVRPELERDIDHVAGPPPPPIAPDELVVTLLVRDGAPQLRAFVEHHRRLGHIVLLDNGSSDETVEIASGCEGLTVYRTALPFKSHKQLLRAWMRERFSGEGWSLNLDIDERFHYPFEARVTRAAFLRYLNRHGYTAVQAEMLDLFPLEPTALWRDDGSAEWYDLSDVLWKRRSHRRRHAFGGIRLTAFGVCPMLSKYPLLRFSKGARPSLTSSHKLKTGRPADVTALLEHHKFDRRFPAHCRQAVEEGVYWNDSAEYREYLRCLESESDFRFHAKKARRFSGPDPLLDEGFLIASERYRRYAGVE